MALYIPASARRRRTILVTAATLVIGLTAGALIGRTTAPTADERIHSIQEDARRTAAGLRVLALHDEAAALANTIPGDGGANLVLERTKGELVSELDRAAWIGATERRALLDELAQLTARNDRADARFGTAAEALATQIEASFGVTG